MKDDTKSVDQIAALWLASNGKRLCLSQWHGAAMMQWRSETPVLQYALQLQSKEYGSQ